MKGTDMAETKLGVPNTSFSITAGLYTCPLLCSLHRSTPNPPVTICPSAAGTFKPGLQGCLCSDHFLTPPLTCSYRGQQRSQ